MRLKDLPKHLRDRIKREHGVVVKPAKRAAKELPYPLFEAYCETWELPKPEREYPFHPFRKWRFDFAWPHVKVALECDGGVWASGRHNRGAGFIADQEKLNEAAIMGWVVIRCVPDDMESGKAFEWIRRAMQ